jgi:hypothetical protein|tara:strand:+ start:3749 stop:4204 length:456 start_codon:yes stop_codon:yes gene_type:complete
MTQALKHLDDFVKYSDYIGAYAQGEETFECRVNKIAFPVIDKAINDFMEYHGPCVFPIKQGPREAFTNHMHEILDELSLLQDKSTLLNQELKFTYNIPTTDPNSADLYGIDVRMQFYLLPPDTVQGPKGKYFSKMVVIHIDELENYDYILG